VQLTLEKRAIADARQALRALAHDAAKAASAPGCENDGSHAASELTCRGRLRPASATALSM
jgi:hypothetical protein